MNQPKTLLFEEKDPDPNFTLAISLAWATPTTDSCCGKNSLSIKIIIKDNANNIEGLLTILEGNATWECEAKKITAYQANVVIDNRLINAMVYHCKKNGEEYGLITLLDF